MGVALVVSLVAMATLSFNATRVAGWSVSDLLFMASGGVIALKLLTNDERFLTPRRGRRGSHLVLAGVVLMLTGATLSALGSWTPLASMMVVVRLGWSTLVWFWILRSVCRDRQALFSLVNAVRVTVLVSAVLAVAGDNGILQVNSKDFGDGRQAAFTYHPGELMNFLIAGFFLVAVPVLVPTSGPHRRLATIGWIAGVVVVTLGIFATGSTSAVVALGAAIVAVVAVVLYSGSARVRRRRRTPLTGMLVVAGAVAGVFLLFTSDLPVAERLTGFADGTSNLDDSLASRSAANREIINDFDHYLLVGIGPFVEDAVGRANIVSNGKPHNHVHNMHLKMLYEAGLPAMIGLWIIIVTVARQACRLVVSTRGTDLYPIALGIFGGFVAANVSSMFGPTAFARHFWLSFALIGCLWSVRRLELADAHGDRPRAVER
jgi:O-Antigen ligase